MGADRNGGCSRVRVGLDQRGETRSPEDEKTSIQASSGTCPECPEPGAEFPRRNGRSKIRSTKSMDSYDRFIERQEQEIEYLSARQKQLRERKKLAAILADPKKRIEFIEENWDKCSEIVLSKAVPSSRHKDFAARFLTAVLDEFTPMP